MRLRWVNGLKWVIYLGIILIIFYLFILPLGTHKFYEEIKKLKNENEILKNQIQSAKLILNTNFSSTLALNNEYSDFSKIPVEPFLNVLPHLQSLHLTNPNITLNPIFLAKNQNNILRSMGRIIIGIPTVKRDQKSYLLETIRNCLDNIRPEETSLVTFIILIAERKFDSGVNETVFAIKNEFQEAIYNGILEVIMPPTFWYPPDLDFIEPTFGDSQERMIWRTKQNLDYAYLMIYAKYFYAHTDFYVQLEDDVISKFGYLSAITSFADNHQEKWFACDFSKLGFIGKLFNTKDLPLLSNFILLFYRQKPVDWILDQLFMVRYCDHEKSGCIKKLINGVRRLYHKPALFQHIGRYSSLSGKVQLLKETSFKLKASPAAPIPHTKNFEADQISSTFPVFSSENLLEFYNYSKPLKIIFNQKMEQTVEEKNQSFVDVEKNEEIELLKIEYFNPILIHNLGLRYFAHFQPQKIVASNNKLPFRVNLCSSENDECSEIEFPHILHPKIKFDKPQKVSKISIVLNEEFFDDLVSLSLNALLIS